MRFAVAAGCAVLAWSVSPVAAQNACREDFQLPAAGSWAEYKIKSSKGDEGTLRFVALGKEGREGKDFHWVEMQMTNAKGQNFAMKMLVPGWPADQGEVQEIIMQGDGQVQPLKFSKETMAAVRGAMKQNRMDMSELCQKAKLVGTERVTVPAGSFEARKYEYSGERGQTTAWVTRKSPFGWVRSVTDKGDETVMVSTGSGGKSKITGEAKEMPGMGGMGMPRPKQKS